MSRDGLLLVDKDEGWTSHDVVAKARRLCATRRVGHAGTLDPMATGLLVLGVGKATRLLTFLVGLDKRYTATVRLGESSTTDDAQGQLLLATDATMLTRDDILGAVSGLTGSIEQVPSSVSAVKVDGQRAYARVRAGEDVRLDARAVRVDRFDVAEIRGAGPDDPSCLDVDVTVDVSSGTYIRALARDLGKALGVGGHLVALRRERVGSLTLDRAHTVAQIEASTESLVLDMATVAGRLFRTRHLDIAQEQALRHGQRIPADPPGADTVVAAIGPAGDLVAVLDESERQARSRVVFRTD